jgi:hypothetical protein
MAGTDSGTEQPGPSEVTRIASALANPRQHELHVRDGHAEPVPDYYFWICAADACNCPPWELLNLPPDDPQPSRLWWGHASIHVKNAQSEAQEIMQKKANKGKHR